MRFKQEFLGLIGFHGVFLCVIFPVLYIITLLYIWIAHIFYNRFIDFIDRYIDILSK